MAKRLLHSIGILLLALIFYKIGSKQLIELIRGANLPMLLLALSMLLPVTLLLSLRFHILLRESGLPVSFPAAVRYQMLGQYYGFITPGKIGSFVRMYLIRSDLNLPLSQTFSPVFYDRLGDLIGMGSLAFLGTVILIKYTPIFIFISCSIAGCMLVVLGIFMKRQEALPRIAALFRFIIPPKIYESVAAGARKLDYRIPKTACLVKCSVLSLVGWALIFFQGWLVALNFTKNVPWFDYICISPIASIVGLIPITVSGFGTRDATFLYLMSFYLVPHAVALLISLMAYLVNAAVPSLIGALLALFELITVRNTKAVKTAAPHSSRLKSGK